MNIREHGGCQIHILEDAVGYLAEVYRKDKLLKPSGVKTKVKGKYLSAVRSWRSKQLGNGLTEIMETESGIRAGFDLWMRSDAGERCGGAEGLVSQKSIPVPFKTESGVAVFSRRGQDLFGLDRPLTNEELEHYVGELIGWAANLLEMVIINTPEEIPFDAPERL